MFDGKTVTAVFVSLAIIAVLTSGQNIQTPDNLGNGSLDLGSLLPSGEQNNFQDQPVPNNTVEADFTADLNNKTLQVYQTNITSQNLNSINSIGLNSEQPITLRGFTGTVNLEGKNVKLVGDAEGYSTSNVDVQRIFQVNNTHSTSQLTLETVKFQNTFNQTKGTIQDPSGQSSETADKVIFNSFTGTLVLNLETKNVRLNGKVDRLESGSFVIN